MSHALIKLHTRLEAAETSPLVFYMVSLSVALLKRYPDYWNSLVWKKKKFW